MTKVITIQGRDAFNRTVAALAKSFPRETARALKENIMPTSHAQMIEELSTELAKLERAVDHEIALRKKIKRSDTAEDRWSAVGTDGFDDAGDDDDDAGDAGDAGDDDDDDEDDTELTKNIPNSSFKFQAQVDRIARAEGIPHDQAMTQARLWFPDLYQGYKAITSDVSKGAGNYDSLLQAEMAKGVSQNCARQRLAQAGIAPRADDRGVVEFMAKVQQEQQRSGCNRVEAMQKVRREQPDLFEKYQMSRLVGRGDGSSPPS